MVCSQCCGGWQWQRRDHLGQLHFHQGKAGWEAPEKADRRPAGQQDGRPAEEPAREGGCGPGARRRLRGGGGIRRTPAGLDLQGWAERYRVLSGCAGGRPGGRAAGPHRPTEQRLRCVRSPAAPRQEFGRSGSSAQAHAARPQPSKVALSVVQATHHRARSRRRRRARTGRRSASRCSVWTAPSVTTTRPARCPTCCACRSGPILPVRLSKRPLDNKHRAEASLFTADSLTMEDWPI